MTTGRINQVARPPRRANIGFNTRCQPSWLSLFRRFRLCEERGARAASSYSVSVIRDQEHKQGSLDDVGLFGRHQEAALQAPCGRRDTPQGRTRRRQPLGQTTSRKTGSSTQELVNGTGTKPILLTGQGALESAEVQRGTSRQSRVQNHSSASKPLRSSHPSIPAHMVLDGSTRRKATEGPQRREVSN